MSLKQNIIYLYFKGRHLITSKSQYQYNHGQYLYFADLNLPQAFEVHFSDKDKGKSKTQIGSNNMVEIPDEYFWNGALQIYAWIYLHSNTDDGETIYEVKIPLTKRAKPTDEEPLPQQESAMERAIAELNNAVEITTENANKTEEDKTQVGNIRDEVVDLKENIDATAETVTQKSQEAIDASRRSEASAQNAAEFEDGARRYSEDAGQSAQEALESKNIAKQKAQVANDASAEAKDFRDEAETFKNEAEQAKQNIVDYRDETKSYRDETLTAKDDTQTIKGDVQSLKIQIDDTADNVFKNAREAYQSMISADNASLSASESAENADQSAQSANTSASNASRDADRAEQAANGAEVSATSAQASATASANSATESAQSASQSAQIKSDVEDLVDDVQASAASASTSASQASTSATASAQSASQSAQIKADVEGMVDDAQGYANSASQSASQASASEQGCARAVLDAASAASIARARADEASGYAQTASTKASEAVGCVETATQKATESAQSASQALDYKNDAESAKTASQTAQGLAESARDSAVQAKTDAESAKADAESARDEAQQAVASISSALDDKAPVITDTASGSIASFSDGANDLPLKSLVVDINPVQDLHGQDAPYPAGGGKNLLPYAIIESPLTKNGITFVRNQDGSIVVNGTSTASFAQTFVEFSLQPGSYYFNCGNSFSMQQNTYVYIRDIDNGITLASITIGNIGTDRAFSIDVQTNVRFYMVFGQTDLVISGTLYPMIRLASVTDATYAPYENICPISGWTEINAYNDPLHGGNIEWNQLTQDIDSDYANKWLASPINYTTITVNDDTIVCTMSDDITQVNLMNNGQKKRLVVGHKYLYSVKIKSDAWASSGNKLIIIFGGYWVRTFYPTDNVPTGKWFEASGIWTSSVANELQPTVRKYRDENNYPFEVKQYMIFDLTEMFGAGNEPSTVEEFRALFPNGYYPYNEGEKTTVSAVNEKPYTHVTINLGQTVYGGKLDVLSGELVIDRAMVDLGTLDWTNYSSSVFYAVIDNRKFADVPFHDNAICTEYVLYTGASGAANIPNNSFRFRADTDKKVYLRDDRYTDAITFKTAMNGVMLCYELATPIEIQLDSHTLNSLYGVNNIWADSGDTEVEYRADTKLFIERLTAPDSADMIADTNITSGQYFMVGNNLFKATANIANGAQIIVGTNCIRKSLSEALNEINT